MIIDTHVHAPPSFYKEKMKRWDYMLTEASRNGVDIMILSHLGDWSEFPSEETIRNANDEVKEYAEHANGNVIWLAYLNPQLSNWNEELQRCVKNGARGIKLWVALKDKCGNLKNTDAVLKKSVEYKLPVLLHTFNRTGGNHPGEISVQEFVKLSRRNPRCLMIAAHYGGNWRYSLGEIKACSENAFLDISGGMPEAGMLETLVRTDGADRILFGSDATGRSFASQIAKVTLADIDEKAKKRILWENAIKVYNLKKNSTNAFQKKHNKLKEIKTPSLAEEHFCFCGNWPFWKPPCSGLAALSKLLAENGINVAYTASLDNIFRLDLTTANKDFLKKCKKLVGIKPLATINPLANNWESLVKEAAEQGFSGGFISPYLHCWAINDPTLWDFFNYCAEKKLRLWVNCGLGDHRFRHNAFSPRSVAEDELTDFMKKAPDNQYVLQGIAADTLKSLLKQFNADERFFFEFSRLTDQQGALKEVLNEFGNKRLVAGSEFPFRYLRQTRDIAKEL